MATTPKKRLTDDPFKASTGGLDLLIPKKQPLDNDSHTDENTSSPEPAGEPRERRPSKSRGVGRPRVINRKITKASQEGLRDGLTRATFIVPEKTLAEIKEIVFKDPERRPLKDHIAEALSDYVKKVNDKEVK